MMLNTDMCLVWSNDYEGKVDLKLRKQLESKKKGKDFTRSEFLLEAYQQNQYVHDNRCEVTCEGRQDGEQLELPLCLAGSWRALGRLARPERRQVLWHGICARRLQPRLAQAARAMLRRPHLGHLYRPWTLYSYWFKDLIKGS